MFYRPPFKHVDFNSALTGPFSLEPLGSTVPSLPIISKCILYAIMIYWWSICFFRFFSSSELSDGWTKSQCAQCRGCHLLLNGPIEWCATKHTEACGFKAVAASSGPGNNYTSLKSSCQIPFLHAFTAL